MPKLRVIIKPPPEPQGDAEQQTEALRDYLLQMSEELAYVLTHLEADNINDSTFERIQSMIPRPYTGLPVMDGDASSGQSEQWARGDHRHGHDSSKADVTALEAEAAAREAHEDDTDNPHEVTKAQVGLGDVANERQYSAQNPPPTPSAADVGAIPTTAKGTAGGVAELDSNGMVPSAQLPSYVDDVLEYASLSAFPATGETGKIYVALDTNKTYRWSGSAYVEISESLALGETASTAYRGDRGKTAYDHSQLTSGNPHNVTAAEAGARPDTWMPTATDVGARPDTWTPTKGDIGLGNVENERQYSALNPPPLPTPADIGAATAQDLTDHVGDTANPHSVTAAQVGLGNVDNVQQYSASNPPPVPDAEDIPYDNTTSGLMATDVQAAIDEIAQGGGGGGTAASAVSYDNTGSGLSATNVQDAIDEVYGDIPAQASDIGAQDEITASGILKGDGAGGVSAATAGTDYQAPLTAGTDYATPAQLADKAAKADLTSIQASGATNTTGAAIPAGAYFYLNGILHRAKEQIGVNATFTVNTNCEAVPEGGLNSFHCLSGELSMDITGVFMRFGSLVTVYLGTCQVAINGSSYTNMGNLPFACYQGINTNVYGNDREYVVDIAANSRALRIKWVGGAALPSGGKPSIRGIVQYITTE